VSKERYTTDGEEWVVLNDMVVIPYLFCGYDGCGEGGPVKMNANCLIEMLEALGYDLSEVELK